ncbi:MAG: F0F1 ATP synthase subunit B [Candidatus Delongbacteria bacterium]|nr:F0F1 ATP synthase subunit B [Candidatus Delongbacteria bacterium]MBN2836598.1 F0F1 ATP synthase subunit B [Candidatus Delongbacteria bacterium]
MVSVDLGLTILVIVSFFILLVLFSKMFWNPILKNINDRENGIRSEIENAKKANEEAQKLKKDYEQTLKDANSEATRILQQAREEADKSKNELLLRSKTEAEHLINKAKLAIEQEKDLARKELRSEVINLTILATGKLAGKILSKEDHAEFISNSIETMSR